jgi:DNA-3-methyladenine glycosylase II
MFAIFSLRRPNILPVGDLGVQRGVLRWFISQHTNPQGEVKLNKEDQIETKEEKLEEESQLPPLDTDKVPQTPKKKGAGAPPETPRKVQLEPNVVDPGAEGGPGNRLPVPFTPSISRVLRPTRSEWQPPALPSGLSVGVMKSRLDGKKKIKLRSMQPFLVWG